MITNSNIQEMEDICILLKKENLKNLLFSPVTSTFGRACDYSECKFEEGKIEYISNLALKMLEKYPDIVLKTLYYENGLPVENDNCGVGWQHATISSTGLVKSCVMLDEKISSMGSIYEQSISDIINSPKGNFYSNFSKKMNDEACILCEDFGACSNCIARIYTINRERLNKGKELCSVVKNTGLDQYLKFD